MAAVQSSAFEDPNLGSGPDEDEISLLEEESDSGSMLSDDSVLPDYEQKERKRKLPTHYMRLVSKMTQRH